MASTTPSVPRLAETSAKACRVGSTLRPRSSARIARRLDVFSSGPRRPLLALLFLPITTLCSAREVEHEGVRIRSTIRQCKYGESDPKRASKSRAVNSRFCARCYTPTNSVVRRSSAQLTRHRPNGDAGLPDELLGRYLTSVGCHL